MKLKIAVIGSGARGRAHAAAWRKEEDTAIVACCDELGDRADALAKEHGATAYTNWRDAVLHEGVNVVSNCTPTFLHAPVACLAAANGRHILSEKPLALTLEQGEQMQAVVKAHRVLFMPFFQTRDRSLYKKCRELIQGGGSKHPVVFRYADIRSIRPKIAMHRRSMNGGPVIDMACHIFDIMRFMTDDEPARIYATGRIFGGDEPFLADVDDLAIDAADIELTMKRGHQLQMCLNWGLPEGFAATGSSELITSANLQVHQLYDTGQIEVRYADRVELFPAEPPVPPVRDPRVAVFADAVRGKGELDVTGADALVALKLSLAALESIETGQAVSVA